MNRLLGLVLSTTVLLGVACGDDGPEPTPLQADAIATLIDADLSKDERRCVLEELVATGIEPQAIVDGTITGEQDAELLAVAVTCVDDLASVPAFVQSVIDASIESGTPFTEEEAICVIERMGEDDPGAAAAECIDYAGSGDPDGDAGQTGPLTAAEYGDDPTLDLLWDACDRGNNQACDELYQEAPLGSAYLEFARECAGRLPDSVGYRCFLDLG